MLAPNGVEEERGPGYVEYAIYGGEGELPELGEIEAAAGEGLVEVSATEVPDDWADRWQDFHKPLLVGERLWLRPSWEEPREGAIDLVVDPGRAFGTGAHPTTRLCLELLLELEEAGEAERPAHRPRHRLRRARDRRREARLGPGSRLRPRGSRRSRPPRANAAANGVAIDLEHINLRERLPRSRRRRSPTSPPRSSARSPRQLTSRAPTTLVCSGLLPAELDEVAAAFAPAGLAEAERRRDGDWAALLLRRSLRISFPAMLARSITGYSIGLFVHVLAVVLAFGPTFGYGIFFSVATQCPRSVAGVLPGSRSRPLPGRPGHDRRSWRGIYLLIDGPLGAERVLRQRRLRRDRRPLRDAHGFFRPQVRKALELAERDLQSGDTLSAEFDAVSRSSARSAKSPALIVVVTIFFMVVKP